MKKINICFVVIALLTLLSSCNDKVSMLTVINKDGSFSRKLNFVSDSASMHGVVYRNSLFFNVLSDTNWLKRWEYEKDSVNSNGKLLCEASHNFASAKDMAGAYPLSIDGKSILKDCKMSSSFKWFYTFYTFTEVYNDYSYFFKIPITKYLSKEAASYWLTGEPNLLEGLSGSEAQDYLENIGTQAEKWITANIINDAIDIAVNNYDSLIGIPISRNEILSKRDSLIDYVINSGYTINKPNIGEIVSKYFNSNYFVGLCKNDSFIVDKLEDKYNEDFFNGFLSLNVDYNLAMPGAKIIDCGNGVVKDDFICYRLNDTRLLSHDYTITATFRRVNYWAFLVTGVIVVLAVASWGRMGRKR